VAQVLDLGITRMLCHRLILIFPHVCAEFYPEYKDESATARAGNVRTEFLGRRSLAPFISPGYVWPSAFAVGCGLVLLGCRLSLCSRTALRPVSSAIL